MNQPRRRDKDAKIVAILEASRRMFQEHGYASANTNKIAAEAGVSIGLLYKYFPGGKQDIAFRLVDDVGEGIAAEDLQEVGKGDTSAALRALILRLVKGHRETAHNLRAFDIASLENPESSLINNRTYEVGSETMTRTLSRLSNRDEGEMKVPGSVLFHMLDSVIHRHVLHPGMVASDEDLADTITSILMAYLQATACRSP